MTTIATTIVLFIIFYAVNLMMFDSLLRPYEDNIKYLERMIRVLEEEVDDLKDQQFRAWVEREMTID